MLFFKEKKKKSICASKRKKRKNLVIQKWKRKCFEFVTSLISFPCPRLWWLSLPQEGVSNAWDWAPPHFFFFSKLMSLSFNYSSSIKMTESEDIFWAVPGMFPQTRFRAVVLHPGQFAHIIWQHLQTFLVVTTGLGGGSYWYQWAESRDIAEHPTVYRTASHNKGLGSPTCH